MEVFETGAQITFILIACAFILWTMHILNTPSPQYYLFVQENASAGEVVRIDTLIKGEHIKTGYVEYHIPGNWEKISCYEGEVNFEDGIFRDACLIKIPDEPYPGKYPISLDYRIPHVGEGTIRRNIAVR